ncbi:MULTISPECIES: hypothetical protein [unclassified Fibrobacter]|uniref:hypothetical protein n=1 Tax=unclassified Fibrobacter TaxID=2634177 RepID=UPI001114FC44|nr:MULTISPECIES: hypothetical protein [Fibrobacter]
MKKMVYCLLMISMLLFSACSRDDKVVDSRVRVSLVAVYSDSLALLNVDYENLVESYSSYLQGYDTEWNLVESKFFLVNMYREEVLRELVAPSTPCGACVFQLDKTNLIFYDYKFPPFKVNKALKWNFDKNVVEDLEISDEKVSIDSIDSKMQINTFYSNEEGSVSAVRRFYFYLDDKEKLLKEVEMSSMMWKGRCLDFYYRDSSFICLAIDSDTLKLLNEKQEILDSIWVKQMSEIRFWGPKLQIDDRVYRLLENGGIDRKNWLEIQFGRQGESFPIIFSNDSVSVFYGENNL